MESQKESCGKALFSFMKTLLNYRANTSAVDVRTVTSRLVEWKDIVTQMEQTEELLRQQYLDKHETPREQAKQKYAEFLQSKNEKFYEWLRTKKHGDLYQWLEYEYKEDTAPLFDLVHTKYIKTSTP